MRSMCFNYSRKTTQFETPLTHKDSGWNISWFPNLIYTWTNYWIFSQFQSKEEIGHILFFFHLKIILIMILNIGASCRRFFDEHHWLDSRVFPYAYFRYICQETSRLGVHSLGPPDVFFTGIIKLLHHFFTSGVRANWCPLTKWPRYIKLYQVGC